MKWIDLSVDEREAALTTVAERLGIDTLSVEKDWWVTAVLCALFRTSFAPYLLFKGGTSLSKGWGLINRFSYRHLYRAGVVQRTRVCFCCRSQQDAA